MEKGASSTANGSGDSLNGLKFGKKIYFEDVGGGGSSSKSMAAVGKKGKAIAAVGLGQQKAPRCQVEGCNLDLTGVKAYYCRHKVCGVHSKSPRVIVAGLEQRFCQQCSRFHLLSEFDQGKRSCRRRLAGHNERRRKPPPGPLTSRCGRLSSSFHEDNSRYRSFLMDFAYPRSLGSSKDIWPAMRNNDHPVNNQWHGSFDTRVGVVANNQYPTFLSAPEQQSGDCLAGVSDSSCALSLLSTTQPWGGAIAASARPRNHEAPLILASTRIDGGPMAQLNIASSYMNSPWAFRDHSSGSNSLDMGHRQLLDTGNGHFSSELELALQDNRHCPDELGHRDAYDHDHSAMHWSL